MLFQSPLFCLKEKSISGIYYFIADTTVRYFIFPLSFSHRWKLSKVSICELYFSLWRAFRTRHPKEKEEILQFRPIIKFLHLHMTLPSWLQRKGGVYHCSWLMGIQLDLKRTSRPTFIPHNFRKLTAITVLEVKSSWTPFAVLRRRGVSREDPGQHQAEHLVSSQPSPDPAWVLPG